MQELPPLPDGFVIMQGAGDTMPTQQAPTTGAPRGIPGTGPKPPAPRDPLAIRKDELAIKKAERELAQPIDAEKPSATELDLAAKKEGAQKRAATVRSILGEVRGLYEQDIKGQPLDRAFGMTEWIDSLPRNERFRAAANNILPLIRPLVAQTAKEGDSDKEMEVFLSYIPHNDDSDMTIEQKFKQLELLISGMADGKAPSEIEAGFGKEAADVLSDAIARGATREELLSIAERNGYQIDESALDANLQSRSQGGPVNKFQSQGWGKAEVVE